VFEAAFVIDDSDDPSRAATPMPSQSDKDGLAEESAAGKDVSGEKADEKGEGQESGADAKKDGTDDATAAQPESKSQQAASELTPEIKQRLRKLEKLEATYPGKRPATLCVQRMP
jgi:hypothetical protein